jgi:hypothetical protein
MSFWDDRVSHIRHLIANDNLDNFLSWQPIVWTMNCGNPPWIQSELAVLLKDLRWYKIFHEYQEPPVADSIERYPGTHLLGNTIHHMFHCKVLQDSIEKPLSELGDVFEFGAGFGSLSRIMFAAGFKGLYHIYDFPEFKVLRDHYFQHPNLRHLNDLSEIPSEYDALIATWSISETQPILRNKVMRTNYKHAVVAYAADFEGMNNKSYFESLAQSKGGVNMAIPWLGTTNFYYLK